VSWIIYLLTSLTSKVVKKLYYKDYKIRIVISALDLYTFFFFLKKNSLCQYKALIDICVSDFPEKKNRFLIHYSLISYCYNNRICLEINNSEVQGAFSLSNLYNSANWAEREAWDMFGIIFYWHSDLRRILTDYGFSGFPLRKDFPMSGFIEVLYSQKQKRLLYNRVVLAQEYRNFAFEHFTSFWGSQKFTLRRQIDKITWFNVNKDLLWEEFERNPWIYIFNPLWLTKLEMFIYKPWSRKSLENGDWLKYFHSIPKPNWNPGFDCLLEFERRFNQPFCILNDINDYSYTDPTFKNIDQFATFRVRPFNHIISSYDVWKKLST